VSKFPNNVVILFLFICVPVHSNSEHSVPLSARVKTMLGYADINVRVSDSNFNNCLSVGDVKIGEEMILFRIGIIYIIVFLVP